LSWEPLKIRPRGSEDPAEGISLDEFYKTDYWFITRDHALRIFGRRCFRCGKENGSLHVHHRTYRSLGAEDILRDLEILCASCHYLHHRGYNNGRTEIES
jgi:5-methylcytosine-specific restriction endonuclease McrA